MDYETRGVTFADDCRARLAKSKVAENPSIKVYKYIPPSNHVQVDYVDSPFFNQKDKKDENLNYCLDGSDTVEWLISNNDNDSHTGNPKVIHAFGELCMFSYKRYQWILGQLGFGPVRLEFNKLLVYQTRGLLEERTDQAKDDSHIGTFFFGTADQYKGGEIVFAGDKYVLDDGSHLFVPLGAPYRVDVVTKGVRVVLQFDVYKVGDDYVENRPYQCKKCDGCEFESADELVEMCGDSKDRMLDLLSYGSMEPVEPSSFVQRVKQYADYILDYIGGLNSLGMFMTATDYNFYDCVLKELQPFMEITITSVLVAAVTASDDCEDIAASNMSVVGAPGVDIPKDYIGDNYACKAFAPFCNVGGDVGGDTGSIKSVACKNFAVKIAILKKKNLM